MARRQKYKFTKKEYARKGRISTGLAVAAMVLLFVGVMISFGLSGQAGPVAGGFGMMSLMLSVFGFFVGVGGFSEKKCSHIFCGIGAAANGLIMALFIILISLGAV